MLGQGWEDISPNDPAASGDGPGNGIIQQHQGFGLIPRCIAELFEWIDKRSSDESFDFSISESTHRSFPAILTPPFQTVNTFKFTMRSMTPLPSSSSSSQKIFDLLQDRKRQNPLQLRDSDRGSNWFTVSHSVSHLSLCLTALCMFKASLSTMSTLSTMSCFFSPTE
jgi:hypothetical protein